MVTSAQAFLQTSFLAVLAKDVPVMVPLLAASMVSLTVSIERCCLWRRLHTRENATLILPYVAAGDVEQAQKLAHASHHPVVRVLRAGLEYRQRSPGTAMAAAAQAELRRVKASLPMLEP